MRIFEHPDQWGDDVYEYSCPHCCKALQWKKGPTTLSPFNCYGCMERMIDVSKIINNFETRRKYHFESEANLICGSSGL